MGKLKLKWTIAKEKKHIGDEPEAGSTVTNILGALNHFNYFYNKWDAIEFLTSYLQKNDPEFLKTHDLLKMSPTIGWIARMKEREVVLPESANEWFVKHLAELPLKSEVSSDVVSICQNKEETIVDKLNNVMKHDVLLNVEFIKNVEIPVHLRENVVAILQKRHQYLNGDLENLLKSYSKEFLQEMRQNVADVLGILNVKPEKVEPKKEKIVNKKIVAKNSTKDINFTAHDLLTGINSMSKELMFGKTMVAFYLPIAKMIRVFFAEEGKTFEVYGKSVLNVDLTKSFQKKIPSPEKTMQKMLKVTRNKFINEAHAVKTKEYASPHGRVHENHMLIAAF